MFVGSFSPGLYAASLLSCSIPLLSLSGSEKRKRLFVEGRKPKGGQSPDAEQSQRRGEARGRTKDSKAAEDVKGRGRGTKPKRGGKKEG